MDWDPALYGQYGDERSRPFLDLVRRIGASAPRRVIDLGCGTGELTALLARRWPAARVEGRDSSPEMVAGAAPDVDVRLGSIEDWCYPDDADVVVSNAALQWVPTHRALLVSWVAAMPPDGWLAFQVPGNFDAASHALMREVAARYGVADVLRHADMVAPLDEYAGLFLDAGLATDAWETTYVHVLTGDDPVLTWVRGTGLRPVLGALSGEALAQFTAEYGAALRDAYPRRADGTTLLPYRRLFVVGHRE